MKKRRLIAVVMFFLLICVLCLSSCDSPRRYSDVIKYAIEEYGMEKVLFRTCISSIRGFVVDGRLIDEDHYNRATDEFGIPYRYVVGVKNGEIVALIMSHNKRGRVCESKWIFDVPYDVVIGMANEKAQIECDPMNTERFEFSIYNNMDYNGFIKEEYPGLEQLTLDTPLLLYFPGFIMAQSEGEIRLIDHVLPSNAE